MYSTRQTCTHFESATDLSLPAILDSIQLEVCADCDCFGPNLWICLYKNCLRIGCSENYNDHGTLHNKAFPSHCLHMNLSTKRIWCYQCSTEVIMDSNHHNDNNSDQEMDTNWSTTTHNTHNHNNNNNKSMEHQRTNNNIFLFDKNIGLNISNGDLSDISDNNDDNDYNDDDNNIINNDIDDERPAGLVGLQNIGNTCYMNAALQALSNTIPLTRFFLECPTLIQLLSEERKPGLSRTYQMLMNDIWIKKSGGYVVPSGILYGIRNVHAMFRGYHQHDTQEFLRNFMDQLHEELKQICPPDYSLTIGDTNQTQIDTFSLAMEDEQTFNSSSNYDSSEGEYETCDSGVSERSSLSDDNERIITTTSTPINKRPLSPRSTSPTGRKLRTRLQTNNSNNVIDSQPSTSTSPINNNNLNINNKKQIKYRSIISDIFDGKLLSSVQCLTCDRISSRIETFQDLSLPIPSKDHLMVLHGRNNNSSNNNNNSNGDPTLLTCTDSVLPVVQQDGWLSWLLTWLKSWFYGPTVTLHDCLAAFFSTDELKGDNMYSCEKCNKLRNGIKFSKVLQLPEVLCIHLKRFRHELMFSSKISSIVSFPLKDLDMRPYLHTDCISKITNYELFSVICHYGTAGGGHYICYALNSGQWYEFDDQYVTRVNYEKVQSCEAYVLFYKKVFNGTTTTTTSNDNIRTKAIKLLKLYNNNKLNSNEIAYISKQWLNKFNTCCEPGLIDNTDFLCQHGSINPDKILVLNELTVKIPLVLYEFLLKKYGGCLPITNIIICPACQSINKRILYEMETFMKIKNNEQFNNNINTHLISNLWCQQWHNFIHKIINEPPGLIDNSKINLLNYNNQIDLNDCIEISEDVWNFFYNIYGGGPEIRIKSLSKSSPHNKINNNNCDSVDDNLNSDDDQFIIPTLINKKPHHHHQTTTNNEMNKSDLINNKTMYCSGEPMETNNDNADDDDDKMIIDNNVYCNGYYEDNNQLLNSNSKLLNNIDHVDGDNNDNDDTDVISSNSNQIDIKNNKRYRRRRKALSSI